MLASFSPGGCSLELQKSSYLYGTYVGQAFQLVDDALDFEGTLFCIVLLLVFKVVIAHVLYLSRDSGSFQSIGKAPLADLKSGLATAPTLFACEEFPQLIPLIRRKFENTGDVEIAAELVHKSQGLKKTKDLAQVHAEHAIKVIQNSFPPSDANDALIALAVKIITRSN